MAKVGKRNKGSCVDPLYVVGRRIGGEDQENGRQDRCKPKMRVRKTRKRQEKEIEEENERKGRASGLSKRTEGRATPN